ncbi:MAG: hypothetical protein ACOCW2_01960 [Chitinivibrionales bacterium]
MQALITRLIDPAFRDLCEKAGIAEQVESLKEVEQKIAECESAISTDLELEAIRSSRYCMCCCMELLTDSVKPKSYRKVKSYEALNERIREKELCKRLEMFSLDVLSPTAFEKVFRAIEPQLFNQFSSIDNISEEISQLLKEYRSIMDQMSSHYLWKRFDEQEGEFYRSCVQLLDQITIHIPFYIGHDDEIWQWHYSKRACRSASFLLDQLTEVLPGIGIEINMFSNWTPDCSIGIGTIDTMLTKWDTPSGRKHLQRCGSAELFDFCRHLRNHTQTLAEEIVQQTPPTTLFRFRLLRHRLTIHQELVAVM